MGEHHLALWCLTVSSMKLLLLVLSAIMSIKAVQGCCPNYLPGVGCSRDLNRDLKTASLDMVQRIDRAIPKLGLMSNGPQDSIHGHNVPGQSIQAWSIQAWSIQDQHIRAWSIQDQHIQDQHIQVQSIRIHSKGQPQH